MDKKLPAGTRVRLTGITDKEDLDLNGREGVICPKHRFGFKTVHHAFGDIGVALDSKGQYPERVNVLWPEVAEVQ